MAEIKRQFLDYEMEDLHKFVIEFDGKEIEDGVVLVFTRSKSNQESMAKLKEVSERCYNKEPKYVIVDVATGVLISYARSKKRCLEKYEDIRTKYYEFKQTNQYEKYVIQFKSLTTTI